MIYYIYVNQNRLGPYSSEQLHILDLPLDTPVWQEGLTDWVTIHDLKVNTSEKCDSRTITQSTGIMDEIQPVYQPKEEQKSPSRNSFQYLIVGAVLVTILIVGFIYTQSNRTNESITADSMVRDPGIPSNNIPSGEQEVIPNTIKENTETPTIIADEANQYRENWMEYVTTGNNQYLYSDLGGISQLEISVSNNSPYKLDEVLVLVSYIKVSGEIYKNETMHFIEVEPNTEITMPAPDSPRGIRIEHTIMNLQSTAMGLYFPN